MYSHLHWCEGRHCCIYADRHETLIAVGVCMYNGMVFLPLVLFKSEANRACAVSLCLNLLVVSALLGSQAAYILAILMGFNSSLSHFKGTVARDFAFFLVYLY
jgi:hypothetical protein